MLNKILFFFIFLACLSCQGEQDKTATYVAKDICTCFKPLVEINDEIQSMIKDGQNDQAETLMTKVGQINADGQKCAMDMVKKYGADTQLNTEKIGISMKAQCPKIHNIVAQALFAPN